MKEISIWELRVYLFDSTWWESGNSVSIPLSTSNLFLSFSLSSYAPYSSSPNMYIYLNWLIPKDLITFINKCKLTSYFNFSSSPFQPLSHTISYHIFINSTLLLFWFFHLINTLQILFSFLVFETSGTLLLLLLSRIYFYMFISFNEINDVYIHFCILDTLLNVWTLFYLV